MKNYTIDIESYNISN